MKLNLVNILIIRLHHFDHCREKNDKNTLVDQDSNSPCVCVWCVCRGGGENVFGIDEQWNVVDRPISNGKP